MSPGLVAAKALAVAGFLLYAWLRPSPFLRVVVLCFAAQVGYAVVQDQITVRVCPEYFTVGHARIGTLTDPTLVGLTWAFLAGGSGGALMGLVVSIAATSGRRRPLTAAELLRPVLLVLLAQALATAACGLSAYVNAELTAVRLGEPWAGLIPERLHRRFFA